MPSSPPLPLATVVVVGEADDASVPRGGAWAASGRPAASCGGRGRPRVTLGGPPPAERGSSPAAALVGRLRGMKVMMMWWWEVETVVGSFVTVGGGGKPSLAGLCAPNAWQGGGGGAGTRGRSARLQPADLASLQDQRATAVGSGRDPDNGSAAGRDVFPRGESREFAAGTAAVATRQNTVAPPTIVLS